MNWVPAIFLGGFGMMATFWLTRSMRASEPVVGVTPTTLPARTAALCAVAIVPFACGCLALLAVRAANPGRRPGVRGVQPVCAGRHSRRADSRPIARRPVARCRAGPLGAVPWRRLRAVPDPLRLGESGDGPVRLASGLDAVGGAAAVRAVRLLHAHAGTPPTSRPGAGRRGSSSAGSSPCARSRSWWRCCAGPRGGRACGSSVPSASRERRPWSCSCWPLPAGSPTPSPRDGRTGAAGRGVAGGRGPHRCGGRGGRLRRRVPRRRHHAVPDLLRAARRSRSVHPRRAGQPGRRRDADRGRPAHHDPRRGACWHRSPPARW